MIYVHRGLGVVQGTTLMMFARDARSQPYTSFPLPSKWWLWTPSARALSFSILGTYVAAGSENLELSVYRTLVDRHGIHFVEPGLAAGSD